jgi:hypothetical protein
MLQDCGPVRQEDTQILVSRIAACQQRRVQALELLVEAWTRLLGEDGA